MTDLTKKQRDCLDAIASSHAARGISPTVEELRAALGFASKSSVVRVLRGLEQRCAIRRRRKKARAISILIHNCPHCGKSLDATKGKTP